MSLIKSVELLCKSKRTKQNVKFEFKKHSDRTFSNTTRRTLLFFANRSGMSNELLIGFFEHEFMSVADTPERNE